MAAISGKERRITTFEVEPSALLRSQREFELKERLRFQAIAAIWKKLEFEYPIVVKKGARQMLSLIGNPENFPTFKHITALNLSNLTLPLIPDELFVGLKNLKTLNLAGNALHDLPETITYLTELCSNLRIVPLLSFKTSFVFYVHCLNCKNLHITAKYSPPLSKLNKISVQPKKLKV